MIAAFLLAAIMPAWWHVQPGACGALSLEKNVGAGWVASALYADSLAKVVKTPRVSESDSAWADSGFVVATQSGPTVFRLRCINGPASNYFGLWPRGSFARDTTAYAVIGNWWHPLTVGPSKSATWQGANGDTTMIRFVLLDAEQATNKALHCTAAGYWWLHGVKQACP